MRRPCASEFDVEELNDTLAEVMLSSGSIMKEGAVEAYMKEHGWKLITEEWLARLHANGKGCSWMHRCANGRHWNLAKKTDAGRVRCKECSKMLDEAPQMLLDLQKLKGIR